MFEENAPERAKELLSYLRGSKDLTGFLAGCAKWTAEEADDIRPVMRPPCPAEVREYLDMPLEKRIRLKPEFFHEDRVGIEVLKYKSLLIKALYHNIGRMDTLKMLVNHSQEQDVTTTLVNKIQEFREAARDILIDPIMWNIAKVEPATESVSIPEEAQRVIDEFGGEVWVE